MYILYVHIHIHMHMHMHIQRYIRLHTRTYTHTRTRTSITTCKDIHTDQYTQVCRFYWGIDTLLDLGRPCPAMAMGLGCNYVIPMVYWEGTVLTTVIQLLPSVCGPNGALDWGFTAMAPKSKDSLFLTIRESWIRLLHRGRREGHKPRAWTCLRLSLNLDRIHALQQWVKQGDW
jgi:hypothetical protein